MSNQPTGQQSGEELSAPKLTEFPTPSYEEWRTAAEAALKGAAFEKQLITRTHEGIDLQPMYRVEDTTALPHMGTMPGFAPYVRGTEALGYQQVPWGVSQEIGDATPEGFNQALTADLKRGQTVVNMRLDVATLLGEDADVAEAGIVGNGGVSISSLDDLGKALQGVDLQKTPIFVQAGASGIPIAAMVLALLEKQSRSKEGLSGCIGSDPLGVLARTGKLPRAMSGAYADMAHLTSWASANAPHLQTVLVSVHPYHDGGGSAVQELAFAIATGVEYLRELQSRGLSIDQAAPRFMFTFSLGSNFFMEIAKLRAARLLWARVVAEFGGGADAQKMRIHARTSCWNKTLYDPNVNMLRTTTEAFSGVLGGCDSMHIGPMDEVARVPNDFTRRVARNTHTVLREEAGMTRTIDPAGGSWYVENLTDQVARQSWELFREVEKKGGMAKALQTGFPQAQVAATAAQRAKAYAQRRDIFVGTNMYANAADKSLEVAAVDRAALQQARAAELQAYRSVVDPEWRRSALEKLAAASPESRLDTAVHAVSGGATLGDLCEALAAGEQMDPLIEPVRIRRGAEDFEDLRRRAEAFAKKTGSRPRVFLANMGPIPQHKARADFSRGFLEVGAFEVIGNDGFETTGQAVAAAVDSGAPVVVICSTDKTYPELVPSLAKGIKEAKSDAMVLVAGYPSDHVEAFKQAGVDDFIHLRANCYELLDKLQQHIGVAE
jgi:methylmalonyl-CoA mutase